MSLLTRQFGQERVTDVSEKAIISFLRIRVTGICASLAILPCVKAIRRLGFFQSELLFVIRFKAALENEQAAPRWVISIKNNAPKWNHLLQSSSVSRGCRALTDLTRVMSVGGDLKFLGGTSRTKGETSFDPRKTSSRESSLFRHRVVDVYYQR